MAADTTSSTSPRLLEGLVDDATQRSVERFLMQEALLLDRYAYGEWLPLLEPDFSYRIPLTITRDNPALPAWDDEACIVDETRDSLANLWARRLEAEHVEFAWAENPLIRVRHFVTNVVAFEGEAPDEVVAKSNVLLSAVRQADPVTYAPAERTDVLRRRDEGWGLARRTVRMDESVVTLPHLRIVL